MGDFNAAIDAMTGWWNDTVVAATPYFDAMMGWRNDAVVVATPYFDAMMGWRNDAVVVATPYFDAMMGWRNDAVVVATPYLHAMDVWTNDADINGLIIYGILPSLLVLCFMLVVSFAVKPKGATLVDTPNFVNLFDLNVARTTATTKLMRYASYRLDKGITLTITHGSVTDFASSCGAIVNATNTVCAAGWGVDKSVAKAGGASYGMALSMLRRKIGCNTICGTGAARLLPRVGNTLCYGNLQVPDIILTVGPDFNRDDREELLTRAYYSSLQVAAEASVVQVALPLISAQEFRGDKDPKDLLRMSACAVKHWATHAAKDDTTVTDIVLCARTTKQAHTLLKMCDKFKGTIKASVV